MKPFALLASLLLVCVVAPPAIAQSSKAPQSAPQHKPAHPPASEPAAAATTEPEATPHARQPETERQQPERSEAERREQPQQGGPGGATITNFHFDMHETASNVTHHEITVNGHPLRYTATAGRMPIKNGEGVTEALMFYVASLLSG